MAKKEEKKKEHRFREEDVYPEEEQGILKEETSEEIKDDIRKGEKNEEVYSKEGRDALEEDDEIEPWEEGFSEGADEEGQLGKDALTGEPLMDIDDVTEMEIDGKTYRFANKKNAEKFKKKKEKK